MNIPSDSPFADPYTVLATLDHFYDGDTVWLHADLGFRVSIKEKFRVLGINTPEIRGVSIAEKAYGQEAREFAKRLIEAQHGPFLAKSVKKTKYDYGVVIWISNDEVGNALSSYVNFSDYLIYKGHGVPYLGGTKLPWEDRQALQNKARANVLQGLSYEDYLKQA